MVDAIGEALSNSFTDEEVQQAIDAIHSEYNLPEQGSIIIQAEQGNLYALACILLHDPPLRVYNALYST